MEDYVTYEQARALKEHGFDWECNHCYDSDKTIRRRLIFENFNEIDTKISAPTLSLAQKWLREKEIEVAVFARFDGELRTGQWVWLVRKFSTHLFDTVFSEDGDLNYDTYEEALSAGIDRALKLLKTN